MGARGNQPEPHHWKAVGQGFEIVDTELDFNFPVRGHAGSVYGNPGSLEGPAEAHWQFSTASKGLHMADLCLLSQKNGKYLFNSFKINRLYGLSLVIEKQQVFAAMHPTSGTIFKVSNLDLREKGSKKEL
jgi:hypothetical protein